MPLDANAKPVDAELAELECVVEALARWPRLSQLLRYMGEKLSSGEIDDLNEYDIATEVLGRSKTVFNAGEDAIARVETHRLRKRLTAYYETEGRDHRIQINLPAGSYVPVFLYKPESTPPASPEPAPAPAAFTTASESDLHPKGKRPLQWLIHYWKYLVTGAGLALVALGAYLYFHQGASRKRQTSDNGQPLSAVLLPVPSDASSAPMRLLAGYSGPPRTDSAGRVWNPDRFFSGGSNWQRAAGPLARTSDPFIFEHSRTGDFSYSIPLKPGSYELHLFFSISSESVSTFNVAVNGEDLLLAFDINEDAMGEDIADERIFRDISPGKDGYLRIQFSGAMAPPALNALEILPSAHGAQLPIRLIMQTTPLTDSKGRFWRPDDYFMNGQPTHRAHPLPYSPDPDLFSEERFGHFSYAIPVDARGTYTVILHFVEFYFTSAASGTNGRIFKVMCNGHTLLDNFDIFKEAGTLHEITKTFRHLKPTAQGKLNLTFEPIVNNATVSGIEVLDESQ